MDSTHLLHLGENIVSMMRGAMMMLFVVLSVLLYPRRRENSILNFLFWLLVVMIVLLTVSLGFMIEGVKDNERFNDFVGLLDMCLIPLIAGFLMTIVMPDYFNSRRILILLVPSLAFLLGYGFTQYDILYTIGFIYTAVIALVAFLLVIVISIRYDKYLKNNYSNIDNKTVGWVRKVILVFAAWYTAWSFVISQDNPYWDSLYYLFMIGVWVYIYICSTRHIVTFHTDDIFDIVTLETLETLDRVPVVEDERGDFKTKLELCMDTDRVWLNPVITLQDMALILNTNRTYLSEYFNRSLGVTFYDYLNGYRITYACELLLSEPNLSVLLIGEKSGFKSLSTFRRAFEKQMNMTPSKYRQMNKEM